MKSKTEKDWRALSTSKQWTFAFGASPFGLEAPTPAELINFHTTSQKWHVNK
jgi:hypothetical protein